MPAKLLNVQGPFDVYLESNRAGQTMAHIPQLPGCIVRASTPELAEANIESAIRQYILWLAVHSKSPAPPCPAIHVNIAERCQGDAASGTGSRVALLNADCMPLNKSELKEYLRRMRFSRADLLELAAIPQDALAARSDKRQRSLHEILQHIAEAEHWYLTRLMPVPRLKPYSTPFERLERVREIAYARLVQQDSYLGGKIVTPAGEAWTLRKVLRRFLEHEREHILEIEWRLHEMGLAAFPGWMPGEAQIRELQLAELCQC